MDSKAYGVIFAGIITILVKVDSRQSNYLRLILAHKGTALATTYYTNSTVATCSMQSASDDDSYSFEFNARTEQCGVHTGRIRAKTSANLDTDIMIFWLFYTSCPTSQGYTLYQSDVVCVKHISIVADFDAADATCANDGGHLFMVSSVSRLHILNDILIKAGVDDNEYIILGGSDELLEGSFVWFDGSPITFWGPGQPDDLDTEDCMGYKTYINESGIMDILCHAQSTYLCEIPII